MQLKHAVRLSEDQRHALKVLLGRGREAARVLTRARILMLADKNGEARSDVQIMTALSVSDNTVFRTRQRFAEHGLDEALRPTVHRPVTVPLLDETAEAHLIALACTHEPGHARMSLRLLADKMVELGYVAHLSHEKVRQTLKKTRSSRTSTSNG